MKIELLIGKIFLSLFIVSIITTFFFWTFWSDLNGVDDETEKSFADILNTKFESGDIVFPEVDWDLGFLKYINPGIFPIYLTLKETTGKEIQFMKDDGGKIFFLLKNKESWKKISERTGITEKEIIPAGSGVVVIGSDGTESQKQPLVFTRDIGNAKNIWFSKGEQKFPCTKTSSTKWECARNNWNYVGLTTAALSGKQQRAVWAHPRSGMTLHIQFEIPENGKKMVLNTSFTESGYRSQNKTPVEVEVVLDGLEVLKYTNKSERRTYSNNIDIPLNSGVVEFRFRTDNEGQRHFVFNGYVTE